MRMSVAFHEIVELALRLGVRRINELPACWEHQVDEQWWVAVNGHREEIACSTGAKVPPFCAYVTFNEWPAGILHPDGGVLAAGAAANEDALIDALRKAGPR